MKRVNEQFQIIIRHIKSSAELFHLHMSINLLKKDGKSAQTLPHCGPPLDSMTSRRCGDDMAAWMWPALINSKHRMIRDISFEPCPCALSLIVGQSLAKCPLACRTISSRQAHNLSQIRTRNTHRTLHLKHFILLRSSSLLACFLGGAVGGGCTSLRLPNSFPLTHGAADFLGGAVAPTFLLTDANLSAYRGQNL